MKYSKFFTMNPSFVPVKPLHPVVCALFLVLLSTGASAQSGKGNSPAKPSTASRIADSYSADYYHVYHDGDSDQGGLRGSATAITLGTSANDLKLTFKINETPGFDMLLGMNNDPTWYGYNTGYSRYVGAGSLAFYSGGRGLANSGSDAPNFFVAGGGNVGVGTSSPAYNFQVISLAESFGIVQNYGSVNVGFKTGSDYGGVGTASSSNLKFFAANREVGTFLTNGNLGIGTSAPAQKFHVVGNSYLNGTVSVATDLSNISGENLSRYSMFVNKGILSEDYALGPRSSWADFVFDRNYELKSLEFVEAYIKDHHHLPGMPSGEDVEQKGYSLHEMNVKLLQKVEELTLYIIAQQKEIGQLKSGIQQYEALASQIELLKGLIDKKERK